MGHRCGRIKLPGENDNKKQTSRPRKARAACLFGGLLETSTFPGSRFRLFKRKQAFLLELIGKQPDRIRQRPSDRNGPPDPAHAECGYGGQQICQRDARAQRNDRENRAHPRFSQRTVVSHVSHHNQNKSTAPSDGAFILSMGYEKDIFGSFAYDFELSQKLIFG